MRWDALVRYFYFSRATRQGTVILLGFAFLLFVGVRIFVLFHERQAFDYTPYEATLQAWEAGLRSVEPVALPLQLPTAPFDPNLLTAADWQRFGISERAAQGIIKYRDKSGGFKQKSDVAKLYAVSDSLFTQLAPFIVLREDQRTAKNAATTEARLFPFDPNLASQAELRALGLSPKVARNIIKYRSKGGRFRKAADFEKIYGISAAQFATLAPYLRFPKATTSPQDSTQLEKPFAFDPNTVTLEELQRLGFKARTAKGLLKYRAAGAVFRKPEDLARVYGVSEADYARLEPYIEIGEAEAVPVAAEALVALHPFDPNTATQQELIGLGLPPPVAYGVVRYREAGGQFRTAADFGKLRSISADQYERLRPFIDIAATAPPPAAAAPILEINAATAEDWQALRGIGPAYTRRILEQKERMGGFGNWEMLRRTPGLPDSVYQRIRPLLRLDAPPVTDIYINRIGEAELIAHPLLTKSQALSLLEFRTAEGGQIKNFKRLQKARVAEAVLTNIRPILRFDP